MRPDLETRIKTLEARTSGIGADVRVTIKDVAETKSKIAQGSWDWSLPLVMP